MKLFFFMSIFIGSFTAFAQTDTPQSAIGKTIDSKFMGFNGAFMFASSNVFLRPEAESLISSLQNKVIRFPGGTVANCYHLYKKGSTTVEESGYGFRPDPKKNSCALPSLYGLYKPQTLPNPPKNHIHNFIAHAKRVNAKVVYVANVTWGTLGEIEEVLLRFKKAGVEVVGVELGNELFFGQYQRTGECKNAADYINRLARPVAQRIKELYPNLKIALIAPGSFDDPNVGSMGIKWQNEWNAALKVEFSQNSKLYDAIAIHVYPNSKTSGAEAEIAVKAYPEVSDSYVNIVTKMRAYFKPYFPNQEAWISEWNINTNSDTGSLDVMINTMFQACFAGEFLGAMIKNNDWIKASNYHSYISNGISNGVLFSPQAGYSNLNGSTKITASSSYYTHLFYDKALADKAVLLSSEQISMKNNQGLTPKASSLVLLQGASAKKTHVVYVNCSGSPATLNLGSWKLKNIDSIEAAAPHYSAGGAGWSRENPSVEIGQMIKRFTGSSSGSAVNLGPYTVGVAEVSK